MNKHFEELARVMGRALAKRWMQRSGQGGSDGGGNGDVRPVSPPPPRRRRLRYQQHK